MFRTDRRYIDIIKCRHLKTKNNLTTGSYNFLLKSCVDHNKLWKTLKGMEILDYLTCLLRNLYASQEATVRTEHGTTDQFQIRKGVQQGHIDTLFI